ncbi:hypothetical protein GJU94_03555 [Brucella sp. 10RB9214]|nr:hypothetical protein [Brucella sp. 10RB9212]MRN48910.1 hypothetical protein [Brucella sp. 10RB9214]
MPPFTVISNKLFLFQAICIKYQSLNGVIIMVLTPIILNGYVYIPVGPAGQPDIGNGASPADGNTGLYNPYNNTGPVVGGNVGDGPVVGGNVGSDPVVGGNVA